ncbi:hypothetical protein TrRE_jg2633 [Triparma retinervis]|uniref:Uncharacterized protein n=1 Tax=Triparma retinervis TaxID=2557542 RepID=A0A9W6ZZS7_9STRA|nr:hypothetical protein TrRE_jg2633 [Triparma retinervis]
MDEKKDESNNEPVGNVSFEQCEDKPSTPKSPKLSRAGKSTRSIAQMQALSLKGDKYLLNGTVRKDWMAGKGEVATHFMLQGGVEERVGRLEKEVGELRYEHGKDEAKFRNSGKKIREQKAAVRHKEMDALLEKQGREYMEMAEESTKRDFHFINKYDREIEWLERRNKKYHDDRFEFAKLVPRILMVKLRRSANDPALMVKEVRRNSESPQVAQAAFEILTANLYACPPPFKLALACVNSGVCEEILSAMGVEEWYDNVYLQEVCVGLCKVLCERSVESRLRFDHRMVGYLVRTLSLYSSDSTVLIKALSALGSLCDQCPKQRLWAADVGAGKKVAAVMEEWRGRDWRVLDAGLKSLAMLVVRCPSGKGGVGAERLIDLTLRTLSTYSSPSSYEVGRVNSQVVRSCMKLVRDCLSEDDDGEKERYEYERYLRRGGAPIGEDLLEKEKANKMRAKFLEGGGGEEEEEVLETGEGEKCAAVLEGGGGFRDIVKAAEYHFADSVVVALVVNVVHAYLFQHCGGAFEGQWLKKRITDYKEITLFLLECLMRYRGNKVIVWGAVCNLAGLCNVDERVILEIEQFGRGNREEDADEEDSMVLDEESLTSGKLDGCRIICSGMKENWESVHLLEQYCRLVIVMSKQLDARMALLRANGIDILEENREKLEGRKGLGGYYRLSMNAHLALETGQQYTR